MTKTTTRLSHILSRIMVGETTTSLFVDLAAMLGCPIIEPELLIPDPTKDVISSDEDVKKAAETLSRILAGEKTTELYLAFAALLGYPILDPELPAPKTVKDFMGPDDAFDADDVDVSHLMLKQQANRQSFCEDKKKLHEKFCLSIEPKVELFRTVIKELLPILQPEIQKINEDKQKAADKYNDTVLLEAIKTNDTAILKKAHEMAQKKKRALADQSQEPSAKRLHHA